MGSDSRRARGHARVHPDAEFGYHEWTFDGPAPDHRYLVPAILRLLPQERPVRLLDLGCGNGSVTARVAQAGVDATGLEATATGIERASRSYPHLTFRRHDLTTPLPNDLRANFDIVLATEVIEHLFLPRELFFRAREALGDEGTLIVSTPYHGYWKNLVLALSGRTDRHHQALSDFGHVKFFTPSTLAAMARECGFQSLEIVRAGRIRPLAATMVMRAALRA